MVNPSVLEVLLSRCCSSQTEPAKEKTSAEIDVSRGETAGEGVM
jgi:hypothetical protein